MLHPVVYFIADSPSKNNISQQVALIGTPSYKTFLDWINLMDVDCSRVRIFNQCDNPFPAGSERFTKSTKVVALGSAAKKYLIKSGIEEFFLLPHPSPANKASHRPDTLIPKLEQCKAYIYSEN